ncbi:enoyl-CoA hydratase/isomerase family protein [Xanthobacter wiegelii]|uniref:enoyl-CoA hydratase/isomerase family protein n=1 Tax=Xanthobacter wiegelii TaxID=3119913 RepID=UPI00372B7E4A
MEANKIVNTIKIIIYMIIQGGPMPEFIEVSRRKSAAILVLRRPEAMNAWHRAMRTEIVAALNAVDADQEIRALIVTGAGSRAFGAGADLKEPGPADHEIDGFVEEFAAFFEAFRRLGKPTIAALNGVAAGSAFQVALMMDFRIAHPGVRMGQPEIRSGVASALGPWIIRETLGARLAADLTLSGRIMDFAECAQLGLFHGVVPVEAVLDAAVDLAESFAALPERAVALTRDRLRELGQPGFDDAVVAWKRMLAASRRPG